jgi:hypothetical protein
MTRRTRRCFSLFVCIVFAIAAATVSVAQDDRAADRAAIKRTSTASFRHSSRKMSRPCARRTPKTGLDIWITQAGC